ncbi:MAG: hypothetical protein FWF76_03660 [Oscillospiraceae bacterium]|nr:hypothetical protein [Oscillospiraceae bacterium]
MVILRQSEKMLRRVAIFVCCSFIIAIFSVGVSASSIDGTWRSFTQSAGGTTYQYRNSNRVVLNRISTGAFVGAGMQMQCTSHNLRAGYARLQTRLYFTNQNQQTFLVTGGSGGNIVSNNNQIARNVSYWSDSPRLVEIPNSWSGSFFSHGISWAFNGNGYTQHSSNRSPDFSF